MMACKVWLILGSSVMDPDLLNPDQDPAFQVNPDPQHSLLHLLSQHSEFGNWTAVSVVCLQLLLDLRIQESQKGSETLLDYVMNPEHLDVIFTNKCWGTGADPDPTPDPYLFFRR
jgi:hypothetical protein